MPIVQGVGSIFDSKADAIVNAVNCVGVMGAGLAKAFADKYPLMNEDYKACCKKGLLFPGLVHTYFSNLGKAPIIVNFPTKDHWKDPSEIEYIITGMTALVLFTDKFKLESVAIPALGCGLGGLKWEEVKPIVENFCSLLPKVHWIIFDPK